MSERCFPCLSQRFLCGLCLRCSGHILERYIRTGRSSKIDTTHVMLAKHKLGHLIPIQVKGRVGIRRSRVRAIVRFRSLLLQLRLRDVPSREASVSSTSSATGDGFVLLALVRLMEAHLDEHRLLANVDGTVTAGTQCALKAIGTTPAEISASSIRLVHCESPLVGLA